MISVDVRSRNHEFYLQTHFNVSTNETAFECCYRLGYGAV
jgi:hypothetical protein